LVILPPSRESSKALRFAGAASIGDLCMAELRGDLGCHFTERDPLSELAEEPLCTLAMSLSRKNRPAERQLTEAMRCFLRNQI
jgi:hypothetical protein